VSRRPFRKAERGAAQDLFHGRRRRSRLLDAISQIAQQSVWDLLGNTLRDHGLSNLLCGNLLPSQLLPYRLTYYSDLVALRKRLRATKNIAMASVSWIQ
jgi:hypothetical protein